MTPAAVPKLNRQHQDLVLR